jgi:hypothetical protein
MQVRVDQAKYLLRLRYQGLVEAFLRVLLGSRCTMLRFPFVADPDQLLCPRCGKMLWPESNDLPSGSTGIFTAAELDLSRGQIDEYLGRGKQRIAALEQYKRVAVSITEHLIGTCQRI